MKRPRQSRSDIASVTEILDRSFTQAGETLAQLSTIAPVLVVFLRHAGCIFCREALHDIARLRSRIEQQGTRIILVHMGDTKAMDKVLRRFELSLIDRICDPEQDLYRAFGLKRGNMLQRFGPKVVWRSLLRGPRYRIGLVSADAAQMPGVFLIDQCRVIRRFRHQSAADRPNYLALAA